MWGVLRGVVSAVIAAFLVFALLDFHPAKVPRGIWIVDLLLLLAFVMGVRLMARSLIERPSARALVARGKEVLIVGAGDASQLILREMLRNPALGYTPIGFVDDDPAKEEPSLARDARAGHDGRPPALLRDRRPDELLIAIPSAPGDLRERIVATGRAAGISVKTLPGPYELIAGDLNLAVQIRAVEVEDLLGREPVEIDLERSPRYLAGEACSSRAPAARSAPSSAARSRASGRRGSSSSTTTRPASSRSSASSSTSAASRDRGPCSPTASDAAMRAGLREVPARRRLPRRGPQARAADGGEPARGRTQQRPRHRTVARRRRRVGRRALRAHLHRQGGQPEQRDGRSQALGERIVSPAVTATTPGHAFVAVRFGNVLGSRAASSRSSASQIARGGPVTVTHAEMTRFFMTIPEAVQLVLQAGAIGGGGEVFVLDMGEPVKIIDLARHDDPALGQEPGRDIAIEFVGRAARREAARGALVGGGDGDALGTRGHPPRDRPPTTSAGSRTSSTTSPGSSTAARRSS